MRIAVLGTGTVGRTVAPALAALGHEVVVGTRDPEATRGRDGWTPLPDGLALQPYATVGQDADLVVNATNGQGSLAAVGAVGREQLAGTVLLDLANPLDFGAGFPPTLSVKDTDSLAEQIQRAVPEARVVKALNTVTAAVMVDPRRVGDGDTTVFAASEPNPLYAWSRVSPMMSYQGAFGLAIARQVYVRAATACDCSAAAFQVRGISDGTTERR